LSLRNFGDRNSHVFLVFTHLEYGLVKNRRTHAKRGTSPKYFLAQKTQRSIKRAIAHPTKNRDRPSKKANPQSQGFTP
jgi:hypothetical protein